jgi:hypothetical protein
MAKSPAPSTPSGVQPVAAPPTIIKHPKTFQGPAKV